MSKEQNTKFNLGDLVVLKSYQGKIESDDNGTKITLSGNLNHVSPILVIVGIHYENQNKSLYSDQTGEKIADNIKYDVVWFDTKKSQFAYKTVYECFLNDEVSKMFTESSKFNYKFGSKAIFKTTRLEMNKTKGTDAYEEPPNDLNKNKVSSSPNRNVMTFTCPDLLISGIKLNENPVLLDQATGQLKSIKPEKQIKVMWFNFSQQKFSEEYVPEVCLITD